MSTKENKTKKINLDEFKALIAKSDIRIVPVSGGIAPVDFVMPKGRPMDYWVGDYKFGVLEDGDTINDVEVWKMEPGNGETVRHGWLALVIPKAEVLNILKLCKQRSAVLMQQRIHSQGNAM